MQPWRYSRWRWTVTLRSQRERVAKLRLESREGELREICSIEKDDSTVDWERRRVWMRLNQFNLKWKLIGQFLCLLLSPLLSNLKVKPHWPHTGNKEAPLSHPDTNLSVSVSMAAFPLLLRSKLFDWRAKGDSGFDWLTPRWAGRGDSSKMPSSVLHLPSSSPHLPPPPPQVGGDVRSFDYCGRIRWDSGSLHLWVEAPPTSLNIPLDLWTDR